ncbi:MAG: hypothetical protein HYY16_10670 [Planctomycetes bacterium]|nr:hypothetical protein [Planctomycetota bacterium]
MTPYVATSGPLRSYKDLYDRRLDKLPDVGGFPTVELAPKGARDRGFLAAHRRDPAQEWSFLTSLFETAGVKKPIVYGLRDVEKAVGEKLKQRLAKAQEMPFASVKYSISDDDMVLCEMNDFREQADWVNDIYPPCEGQVFFYVSTGDFPTAESYWRNAATGSQRAKEDPFRRDLFWLAVESPLLVMIDNAGIITISASPKFQSEDKLRECITQAAQKAQMELTFPPSLIG